MKYNTSNCRYCFPSLILSHRGEGCLVLGFCIVTSCFILKSNSPLASGHLPFLMCHWFDCLP